MAVDFGAVLRGSERLCGAFFKVVARPAITWPTELKPGGEIGSLVAVPLLLTEGVVSWLGFSEEAREIFAGGGLAGSGGVGDCWACCRSLDWGSGGWGCV